MSGPVVAILGGGVWAPRLCARLAAALDASGTTLRLWARDRGRLSVIAAAARHEVERTRRSASVEEHDALERVLDGAHAVVVLVRPGGAAARAHDERFPCAFGLVGDEGVGPGGLANAYRTVPIIERIARAVRARAPAAFVLALSAPLGLVTRVLLDEGLDAAGACELPAATLARLTGESSGPTPAYAGLNHLGWFYGEGALLAAARDRGLVDGPTLDCFHAAPLHYYYEVFDPPAAARLGLRRDPARAAHLASIAARAVETWAHDPTVSPAALDERRTPWFEHALVPMLAARLGLGPAWAGFANVRNARGDAPLLAALPRQSVVEVPVNVDPSGIHPHGPPPPPAPVSSFLARVASAETRALRAARERAPILLRAAFAALPIAIPPAALDGLVTAALAGPDGGAS